MALPLILAAAAVIKTGLTVAKTYSSYKQQQRQATLYEKQGDFEAMLFGRNAVQSEEQAADALTRGEQAAGVVSRQQRQLEGSQRAAFATQGLNITTGSATDVMDSDRALSQFDQMTLRQNAAREALGYRTQGATYRMQGDWAQKAGRNQAFAMRKAAKMTLLGGAADVAAIWATMPRGPGGTKPPPTPTSKFSNPNPLEQ